MEEVWLWFTILSGKILRIKCTQSRKHIVFDLALKFDRCFKVSLYKALKVLQAGAGFLAKRGHLIYWAFRVQLQIMIKFSDKRR